MFSQGQNFEKLALSNCPWHKENPKIGRKLVTYRVKVVELKKKKRKKKKKEGVARIHKRTIQKRS